MIVVYLLLFVNFKVMAEKELMLNEELCFLVLNAGHHQSLPIFMLSKYQ